MREDPLRKVGIKVPKPLLDRICALDARFWGAWARDPEEIVEAALRAEAERISVVLEQLEARDLREQLFLIDEGYDHRSKLIAE